MTAALDALGVRLYMAQRDGCAIFAEEAEMQPEAVREKYKNVRADDLEREIRRRYGKPKGP